MTKEVQAKAMQLKTELENWREALVLALDHPDREHRSALAILDRIDGLERILAALNKL